MIVPHVRNHAHIGLQNAMLRTSFDIRAAMPCTRSPDFRILGGSTAQNADLFFNIGFASAVQRLFIAGNIYCHRIRTCSFAEYPQTACPQAGLDQPTDRRFPSCAVYMHHVTQGRAAFRRIPPLYPKSQAPEKPKRRIVILSIKHLRFYRSEEPFS